MSDCLEKFMEWAVAHDYRDADQSSRDAWAGWQACWEIMLPATETTKTGCGHQLAEGQWWVFCGDTDMGHTSPVLCTQCGGKYILAE